MQSVTILLRLHVSSMIGSWWSLECVCRTESRHPLLYPVREEALGKASVRPDGKRCRPRDNVYVEPMKRAEYENQMSATLEGNARRRAGKSREKGVNVVIGSVSS